ncbi:hypothetical protein B0H14DRAFT_2589684 [Mycena olivaceomarginata]|nr:hypothetical protein B0H14DRAFT_2589684 [Mycena olivaceomarginata]
MHLRITLIFVADFGPEFEKTGSNTFALLDGVDEDVHILLAVRVECQLPLLPVVADYFFGNSPWWSEETVEALLRTRDPWSDGAVKIGIGAGWSWFDRGSLESEFRLPTPQLEFDLEIKLGGLHLRLGSGIGWIPRNFKGELKKKIHSLRGMTYPRIERDCAPLASISNKDTMANGTGLWVEESYELFVKCLWRAESPRQY